MTSKPSPEGRRIIVAVVTGGPGQQIQAWRDRNDPKEAARLPPHATLCYWAPDASTEELEKQVRHAFPQTVEVKLGGVRMGTNDQGTMYVEVLDTAPLHDGLTRLYDGTHVEFPAMDHWRWHVTCVRDTRERDVEALWEAAKELQVDKTWVVDTIGYLQLRGDRYEPLAMWCLDAAATR